MSHHGSTLTIFCLSGKGKNCVGNRAKGALIFHFTNPCDSSLIPLTRAPREGHDPSIKC